jgi:hypothetical protein
MKRLLLVLMMVSCGAVDKGKEEIGISSAATESPPPRKAGWTDAVIELTNTECVPVGVDKGLSISSAKKYCSCMVDKISYRYSFSEFNSLSDAIVTEMEKDGTKLNCEAEGKSVALSFDE